MAKFHVEAALERDDHGFFRFYNDEGFVDASAWDKVITNDLTKSSLSKLASVVVLSVIVNHYIPMIWCKILLWGALMKQTVTFKFENIISDEYLKIMVPTLKSKNQHCRNQTVFYVEELKKMRLWATEMFDASSKFPTGVLYGSTYDLGNFDECLSVDVPLEGEHLKGRYCMAKFHVEPPNFENREFSRFHEVNASVWDKVIAFSNDRSRASRNDFHLSYCIPSSCQYEDFESSLQEVTEQLNTANDFKITVTVNPRHCQMKSDTTFSIADIAFMSIFLFTLLLVFLATLYDWLMKIDSLKRYKLEGNKHKIVMAFSSWTNLKKLSSETKNDDNLQCIHFLKVYSMFLVILGHTNMVGVGSPVLNANFIETQYEKIEASVFLNGPIIVDTFFTISGFLVCYLILTQYEKSNRKFNFVFLCVHRYIRLTPAYAIVVAFYCTIFIKIGSGPFWLEKIQVEQERCVASWWANLFYLNNYINKDQICMFQSWYITCDMHFFIIALIFMWLFLKKKILGIVIFFITVILSVLVVFTTVYFKEEDPIVLLYIKVLKDVVVNSTFKDIYIPTHLRASPYFIGMLAGYLKNVMKTRKYKMPKYLVYAGWIICVLLMEASVYFAFIFYIPGRPYNALASALYASLHHVTWSCCISWMILAISEGYGGWIQPIASWKFWALLSRITYSTFICHGAVLIYTAATLRHANYANPYIMILYTSAHICLSYFCGMVVSMGFEAPILALEKILLGKDSLRSKEESAK